MTLLNEGDSDRGVRILGGVLLIGAGWQFAAGAVGVALIAIGVIALGTGLVGWCPAYTVFGVSTRKTPVRACPSCHHVHRV
jgi:DUF2892 family protein